tara:strand:+ start:627 stop:860 length:234 start_codon:yes stop_codon:yes gene_type:complete
MKSTTKKSIGHAVWILQIVITLGLIPVAWRYAPWWVALICTYSAIAVVGIELSECFGWKFFRFSTKDWLRKRFDLDV